MLNELTSTHEALRVDCIIGNRVHSSVLNTSSSSGHFDVLRFDDFELNIQSGELRKRGKVLRLQPQPAKVLSVLARQPGKLVTRDELKARSGTPPPSSTLRKD